MTMTTTEARAALDTAQAAEAAEKRKQGLTALKLIRSEIRQVEQEMESVQAAFHEADTLRTVAQRGVETVMSDIAELQDSRPELADVLPADDPEMRDWNREYSRLTALLEKSIARRDCLPDPNPMRFEAVKLGHRLVQLKYAERNTAASLRGERPGHSGGIYMVG